MTSRSFPVKRIKGPVRQLQLLAQALNMTFSCDKSLPRVPDTAAQMKACVCGSEVITRLTGHGFPQLLWPLKTILRRKDDRKTEVMPAYSYNLGDLYRIDINTCAFSTSVVLAFRVNNNLRRIVGFGCLSGSLVGYLARRVHVHCNAWIYNLDKTNVLGTKGGARRTCPKSKDSKH